MSDSDLTLDATCTLTGKDADSRHDLTVGYPPSDELHPLPRIPLGYGEDDQRGICSPCDDLRPWSPPSSLRLGVYWEKHSKGNDTSEQG